MSDPVIDWMRKNGVSVTRRNYLTIAYMGAPPEEIDPEVEAELEDLGLGQEDPNGPNVKLNTTDKEAR